MGTWVDLLAADRIVMLVYPDPRDAVLDAAARLLSGGSPTLTPAIADGLRRREQLGSTAIGRGVAIPHCRSNAFSAPRAAFLRLAHRSSSPPTTANRSTCCSRSCVPEHSRSSTCRRWRNSPRCSPTRISAKRCARRPTSPRCARGCSDRPTTRSRATRGRADERTHQRPRTLRAAARAPRPALARRPARRRARARIGEHRRAPAVAGRLPQHHLSQQGADPRQRGTRLARRARRAPALGDAREDHAVPAAGDGGQQEPVRARPTCATRPRNPAPRCGSRPGAATNCSTYCSTTSRARWRRGSPCTACSWRSTRSAC